ALVKGRLARLFLHARQLIDVIAALRQFRLFDQHVGIALAGDAKARSALFAYEAIVFLPKGALAKRANEKIEKLLWNHGCLMPPEGTAGRGRPFSAPRRFVRTRGRRRKGHR